MATVALTVAGLVSFLVVAGSRSGWRAAMRMGLDFWLAAGLLRLSEEAGWNAIATSAAVVVVRQVVGLGLRARR